MCNIAIFMAKHNDIGQLGEEIAFNFLLKKGYQILNRNWRWGKAEIDLIAFKNEQMIFVEVKTRNNDRFGLPEQNIHAAKQRLLYQAASEFMYQNKYENEFRFDVIAIILEPKLEIKHLKDAFFPGWADI